MTYRESVSLMSNDKIVTFHDVTSEVRQIAARSGIRDGVVSVYSHHTTCCVITQEVGFDVSMTGLENLQQDFVEAFESFLPTQRKEGMYLHPGPKALEFAREHDEDARGCHNTDAHLRSAMVGRSENIALIDGEVDLGEFGHIYFIDFDTTRARRRTVQVTVLG